MTKTHLIALVAFLLSAAQIANADPSAFGTLMGTFNNIPSYSNGSVDYDSGQYNSDAGINTGLKWQCVEYVNRYYYSVYANNLGTGRNAWQFYQDSTPSGLSRYANGGTTAPQVGDILCFNQTGSGLGHVAIIRAVGASTVTVIQQNVKNGDTGPNGTDDNYTFAYNPSTNIVDVLNASSSHLGPTFYCQGWLRENIVPIYTILHNFTGGSDDGNSPEGSLTLSGSTLYGMTSGGGSSDTGTVFKINSDGTGYTILHNFTGGSDGGYPYFGSLTLYGSTLYGMTHGEDWNGSLGTVFKINSDGTGYAILHNFTGGSDGARPLGSLTLSGSTFYGMTSGDGSYGSSGTVFKINSDGTGYTILHNFTFGSGALPLGSLTLSGSTLYGMTVVGGSSGFGTVFKINSNGTGYTILHNFTGGSDGHSPYGSLTLSGSTLYGMTSGGGSSGLGTVFKINSDGTGYTILHNFTAGAWPLGSLTLSGSTLYGMTVAGGSGNDGTVFKINSNGTGYTILHNFTGGSDDGNSPYGSLTLSGSTLYGMTVAGGSGNDGTVFKINSNGTGYTILHNFTGGSDDGNSPYGSLTLSGSTLYGMTSGGGSSGLGTVFKIDHAALVPSPITVATPANPNVGQKPTGLSGHLNYWDVAQNQWVSMTAVPSTSVFDPSRPTIVITHGWNDSISNAPDGSGVDNWTMRMAKQVERIANQNVNILAWDWQAQANPSGIPVLFQYPFFYLMPSDAAKSARNGNVDGGNLAWELRLIGINPAQTQLIGHSNGGDLMGSAATTIFKLMGSKIERLTTLDTPNVTIIGVNATQFIEPKNVNEVEVYYSGDRFVGGAGATVSGNNVFNGEVYPTGFPEHSYVPDWYTNLGDTATIPHAPDPNIRGMNWSIVSWNCPSTWIAEDLTEQGTNTGVFDTASILEQVRLAHNTPLKQMNFYSGEEYQGTHAATITDLVRSFVANLWGNSDGYLFKTITIPADATVMTFDMKVVTAISGDYITLCFGDKVLFCEDITDVDSNFVTMLPIPIPDLAGQTDTLLFTLHHDTDTPGSSVLLDNITFSTTLMAVDLNMDGKVNFTDYAIFANHWMYQNCAEPDWCEGTDFDHSGQVDIFDLVEFAQHWLAGI